MRPAAVGFVSMCSLFVASSTPRPSAGAGWGARSVGARAEANTNASPPMAELTAAALIVAGLSVALRIVTPLVPALIQGSNSALSDVVAQFAERWPGVLIPFACTISLGLLCIYLGARPWSQIRVATLGALGNGLAFMAAALVVAWMLSDDLLAQFYWHPDHARALLVITSGLIGLAIGAMVLAAFKRSERAGHYDTDL